MKTLKSIVKNRAFMVFAVIFLAFMLNFIPSKIALALKLPLFLDSIGTVVAAMISGKKRS